MTSLKSVEQAYWESYLRSIPEQDRPIHPRVIAGHAGNAQITDELLQLYFEGKKWAGSSLVEDFESAGDPLPAVGDYWIVLDSQSQPRCILRTDRVVISKFKDLPEEIAIAEGEGDLSVEYWKRVHGQMYLPHLEKWGVKDLNEARVITEFFTLVYQR